MILRAISLSEQRRSKPWGGCGGMGFVRENPVKEEVIEKLLESLRVVVSFVSGVAPQLHRSGIHRWGAAATPRTASEVAAAEQRQPARSYG